MKDVITLLAWTLRSVAMLAMASTVLLPIFAVASGSEAMHLLGSLIVPATLVVGELGHGRVFS